MTPREDISPELHASLVSIYEEIMWLAHRPNVTAGRARAWYTHVMAESVKRQLRHFTGMVSQQAVKNNVTDLRLEHYKRIQTTLTCLVERHRQQEQSNAEEFVRTLIDCESVHIVTVKENYDAMRALGSYEKAGINLMSWGEIRPELRAELWRKMLRGKVANASAYAS